MQDDGRYCRCLFSNHRQKILIGVANMNHYRQLEFAGQFQLLAKALPLNISRLTVTVVIQANFPHGHHPFMLCQGAHLFQCLTAERFCPMGVDADGSKDLRITLSNFNGPRTAG